MTSTVLPTPDHVATQHRPRRRALRSNLTQRTTASTPASWPVARATIGRSSWPVRRGRYPTAVVVNGHKATGAAGWLWCRSPSGELVGDAKLLVGGAARADGLDAQVRRQPVAGVVPDE